MATTNMRIVIRRDTALNWSNNSDVVLLSGEQGYETDTKMMKIGNGVSTYADLPYFAGGITDIDGETIVMDAAGEIRLNSESVIGDLGTADTIKEYVDTKDDALAASIVAEAAAREAEDSALGMRIDDEILSRGAVDNDLQIAINGIGDRVVVLETDPTTKTYVDGLIVGEASVRADMDALLSSRIDTTNSNVSGLDTQLTNTKNELQSADDAIHLRIDALAADSIGASAVQDSVDALQAADAAEALARIAGDDSVAGLVAAEVTDRIAGDDSVAGLVAAEEAARIAGDDSIVAMLGDSVTALEAADAAISAVADAAAPDDVGAGYGGVISNNGTVNAALLELETELNTKYGLNDNPTFGTTTSSFFVGALNGDVWNDGGTTKILENSTGILTGSLDGGIVGVVDPTLTEDVTGTASDVQDDIANNNTSVDTAIAELKAAVVELQGQLSALAASVKV